MWLWHTYPRSSPLNSNFWVGLLEEGGGTSPHVGRSMAVPAGKGQRVSSSEGDIAWSLLEP